MDKQLKILLLLLVIFALLVGGKFIYLLLFLVSAVYLYSLYTLKNCEDKIVGVFWGNDYQVEKGDKIKVDYKIYNSSIFPVPYIMIFPNISKRLDDKAREKEVYSLLPFEYLTIKKEFKCKHRGTYQVGELDAKIGDIFGIKNKNFKIKNDLVITVYPKVYKLDAFNIFGKEFYGKVSANEKFYEDYSSIKDIRKYQVGDSLKRVNWKVTAKKGELYVKNYDVSSDTQIQLFMDFQLDKYSNDTDGLIEEKLVECAISIIHFALYRDIDINFVTYTDQKISLNARNISRFNEFLELSTRIRPSKNINLGDILLNELRSVSLGSTIIIPTPEIDDNLVSSSLSLKKMGYIITFIVVRDFNKDKWVLENIKLIEKAGIRVYRVDIEDDLNLVLR
ncbi:DUF58 domain-containing protein [Thermohalobacter berrensis]|uniref:DUF58 domain-containing protein n=1 Tax=Thermohalobacter berrensis TaxID=99594 RepID=A0A419T8J8_9FIRM|nr:DUF58 domain-containing protein [Thermohalobacter berrensis]RKD33743.1 hypothetical protein BET03_08440 [Thermohalobacter berrensis]